MGNQGGDDKESLVSAKRRGRKRLFFRNGADGAFEPLDLTYSADGAASHPLPDVSSGTPLQLGVISRLLMDENHDSGQRSSLFRM